MSSNSRCDLPHGVLNDLRYPLRAYALVAGANFPKSIRSQLHIDQRKLEGFKRNLLGLKEMDHQTDGVVIGSGHPQVHDTLSEASLIWLLSPSHPENTTLSSEGKIANMSRRGVSAPLAVQMENLKKSMSSRDQRRNQERMQRVVRNWSYPTFFHTSVMLFYYLQSRQEHKILMNAGTSWNRYL